MLSKLKKLHNSENKGFTIIEVMIVLAIVGLIMLIVFLAVPALQRNSRNTQRKNDAAAVAAALGTYISNSNGKLPNASGIGTATAGQVTFCDTAGCTAPKVQETANIGYYDPTSVFIGTTNAAGTTFTANATAPTGFTGGAAATASKDTAIVALKGACDTTTLGKVNYSPRSSAVVYVTETASGAGNIQCVEQ